MTAPAPLAFTDDRCATRNHRHLNHLTCLAAYAFVLVVGVSGGGRG